MPSQPIHDWYLGDWLATLRMKQVDLMRLTGWDKRKTSMLVSGRQPYQRDVINEAAFALNLQPFELLMHPQDAMALRRLRDSAIAIAADSRSSYRVEDAADWPDERKAVGE